MKYEILESSDKDQSVLNDKNIIVVPDILANRSIVCSFSVL
jgi:hypothetical protein